MHTAGAVSMYTSSVVQISVLLGNCIPKPSALNSDTTGWPLHTLYTITDNTHIHTHTHTHTYYTHTHTHTHTHIIHTYTHTHTHTHTHTQRLCEQPSTALQPVCLNLWRKCSPVPPCKTKQILSSKRQRYQKLKQKWQNMKMGEGGGGRGLVGTRMEGVWKASRRATEGGGVKKLITDVT